MMETDAARLSVIIFPISSVLTAVVRGFGETVSRAHR
jgi:hypothetical protein